MGGCRRGRNDAQDLARQGRRWSRCRDTKPAARVDATLVRPVRENAWLDESRTAGAFDICRFGYSTRMLALGFLAIGAGFPLAALLARQRSQRALWILTGLMILAVLGAALVLATQWAGNRLVESEGYTRVAL